MTAERVITVFGFSKRVKAKWRLISPLCLQTRYDNDVEATKKSGADEDMTTVHQEYLNEIERLRRQLQKTQVFPRLVSQAVSQGHADKAKSSNPQLTLNLQQFLHLQELPDLS